MKTTLRALRALTALVLLTLALSLAAAPAFAASDGGGGTLTVGVPTNRCPVFYRDADTGEVVGIGVDLMRAAAQAAGYDVAFREITEATLKHALDNPEYDLIMPFGSAITSEAGRASVVSDNLIQTPFTLVTESRRDLPALNELRVGMLRSLGGVAETVRTLYPGIQIVMYDTMAECVKALRGGQVDALLHNSYVWSYVLQKPAYADLKMQPMSMFSMDFRAGTLDTPEGRARIERLNGGVASLSDTQRQAIVLDHTYRRLYKYTLADYLYEYGLVILLVALLFASLTVITIQKRRALKKEHEEKLRELIDHDPLTGLLSLNGFRKRVEELLGEHPSIPYLISYDNIKNFKFINDSYGMEAGNELLCFWAEQTRALISDEEAAARIESDHFVVLRRMGGEEQIKRDETESLNRVRTYFLDRGKDTRVRICSGVYVITPEDRRKLNVDHMLDCARLAEKRAREAKRDGYEIYNPQQWEKGKVIADVVGRLPASIKNGELQVWYQPQVDADAGKIIGMEALCRWNHGKMGWLRPAEFIPVLEEYNLIYELDCFVWERVCQDLQRWNREGKRRCASVNLSRSDISKERNIPGHFYDLIQTYDLSPDQLRVEITETAFAHDPDLLIRTTVKLREFGFQVEMDDFGSGYSSLHMLKEVPVDRIKLDLHFLTGAGDTERGRIIVTHIIQMVRALGMSLIAEGVENAAQARFLQSRGCSEMQGFHFHKPMSVEELERLLEESEK